MLDYIRTTLDGLTDAEKQHYKEKDGRFMLDVKDEKDERVQGLIKNKNEAIAEKQEIKKELDALKKSGDGGAELGNAKTRIAELENQLKESGKSGKYSEDQVAQIKRDLETEYKKQLQEKDDSLKTITDKVSKSQKKSTIKDALVKQGVRKGAVDMLAAYLDSRVDVVNSETGETAIRIKKSDGNGHEVSTKDGSVFKTVEELVGDLKVQSDYGFAFEGTKASGGGGADGTNNQQGNNNNGGSGNYGHIKSRADFKTPQEKTAYLEHLKKANDGDDQKAQDAYFTLPDTRPET